MDLPQAGAETGRRPGVVRPDAEEKWLDEPRERLRLFQTQALETAAERLIAADQQKLFPTPSAHYSEPPGPLVGHDWLLQGLTSGPPTERNHQVGRRTLTVSELTFHQKYVRNPASYAPSDLDGDDLADVFEVWAKGLSVAETRDTDRQNWIEVSGVERFAPRVVVVVMAVGSYGEAGQVIDSNSGSKVFELTDTQAPTGENRAVLMVPERGESAYYLAEESTRGSAGGRLLRLFRQHFSRYTSTVTMQAETVSESEAWSSEAALKEVELRLKNRSADIADGPHIEVGTLSYVARPHRRQFFPRSLLGRLGDDRSIARQVVGVSEAPDDADVYVTLERDGRQKKFLIGAGGAPAVREVLNQASEPPLIVDDLVRTCVEKVSDLTARTGGVRWDASWSTA